MLPRSAVPAAQAATIPSDSSTAPAAHQRPGLRAAAITPAMIAQLRALAEPRWSADGRSVFYLEAHDGHGALFAVPAVGGPAMRLTSDPPAASVAAYAGGFYAVSRAAIAYQGADRALYRMPSAGGPGVQIPTGGVSVSAPAFSPDGAQIAYVADDGATADIGIADASGCGWPRKIAVPADFVADPVWSPIGRALAWVEWSVPNMGWDESRVVIGDVRTGERRVVMGEPEVSATMLQWSPDGKTLAFMCDRGGYMNLWRARGDGAEPEPWVTEPFDLAGPTWGSGQISYAWSADGRTLAYLRNEGARSRLRLLDVATGDVRPLGDEHSSYSGLRWAPKGDSLLALYQAATAAPEVVVVDTKRGGQRTLATAALGGLTGAGFVQPETVTWRAADGLEIHGLLYRPTGLVEGERPPLLVSVHGGPTGQSGASWSATLQYFVQRGWAVLAPNARGSSGYGRAYIQALREEWGAADMADIDAGIAHVIGQDWADGGRVVVWGGSAGGYAALLLPALYPDRFKAAVSLFGVGDLFSLARTTHRLEAHYLDRIVGPLPEAADRYRERSPVYRAATYGAPVLMLQGNKDVAVTPDQAQAMVEALRAEGKTVVLHMYEGEGHGWLREATIRDYIARMDRFLEEYALLR
jgi:dipeptidyl aminopeptidase/acylaminoacyl peptidase